MESALNGEEGYIAALKFLPDLILLDIQMPIMDGYAMNQHLKSNRVTQGIPVIVISARENGPAGGRRPSEIEAKGCLFKPFAARVLLTKIEELFSASRPAV